MIWKHCANQILIWHTIFCCCCICCNSRCGFKIVVWKINVNALPYHGHLLLYTLIQILLHQFFMRPQIQSHYHMVRTDMDQLQIQWFHKCQHYPRCKCLPNDLVMVFDIIHIRYNNGIHHKCTPTQCSPATKAIQQTCIHRTHLKPAQHPNHRYQCLQLNWKPISNSIWTVFIKPIIWPPLTMAITILTITKWPAIQRKNRNFFNHTNWKEKTNRFQSHTKNISGSRVRYFCK